VLPFGTSVTVLGREVPLVVAPLEAGVLWVFALLSIGVYGVVLAGYVGRSKFGALGALRGAAQMISYEVATGLSLLGALLLYQTLDLREMVAWQQAHHWGILVQPLGFLLFFTATIVEMKRIPFDLPEGESEIIGYSVEYSGMKFVLFMMAEFIESLLFAWLISLVFLGGWDLPGLTPASAPGGPALLGHPIHAWTAVALQAASLTAKVTMLCWLQMLIRWSLPRLRYDQVMHLGWKIMLPLALGNLVITAVVALLL
jgi:NADH-quinone oxidoreductase subunit H